MATEEEDDLALVRAMERAAEQEEIFLFMLYPFYGLAVLGATLLIAAIVFSRKLHKPRHIFQILGLLNSLVGVFLGVYGLAFLLQRTGRYALESDASSVALMYLFIFHRYLLMLGDLLPSLDRCVAIAFPLKYLTHASVAWAIGLCLAAVSLAAALTALSSLLSVVPSFATSASLWPFNLLFVLASRRFALALCVPYLTLAAAVLVCDTLALGIALGKGKATALRGGRNASNNTNSSSLLHKSVKEESRGNEEGEEDGKAETQKKTSRLLKGLMKSMSTDSGPSSPRGSSGCGDPSSPSFLSKRDLRISTRCLATTLWFFLHQMCTFLPGVLLFGCDDVGGDVGDEDVEEDALAAQVRRNCAAMIATPWPRVILCFFYQLQFLKPAFYFAMDAELADNAKAFWKKCCCCCRFSCPEGRAQHRDIYV